MRIAESRIRRIIREELERVLEGRIDPSDPGFRDFVERGGTRIEKLKPADLEFMMQRYEKLKQRTSQEEDPTPASPRGEDARNQADVYDSSGQKWRVKVGDEVRHGGWTYKVTRAGMLNGKSFVSGQINGSGPEDVLLSTNDDPQRVKITLHRRPEMDFSRSDSARAHRKAMDKAMARRDRE